MAKIGTIVLPTTTASINGQQITYANTTQLQLLLNKLATQLDALTAGQIACIYNAATAPPTAVGKPVTTNPTGTTLGITYGVGDFMVNSNPVVTTYNGFNVVLRGWLCTVAGNVGTANPPTMEPCYSLVISQ